MISLDEYMKQNGLKNAAAARDLKVTAEVVGMWRSSKRIPRTTQMVKIYVWSKGAVTPNSFYDLPDLGARAEKAARGNVLPGQLALFEPQAERAFA